MVRPRTNRLVESEPKIVYFKPQGVPLRELDEVIITIDELETLRLANIEKIGQTESASKMRIHQSTFQRTLSRAREKISDALVNGKAIKIEGGKYTMPQGDRTGPEGKGPKTGRGLGHCAGNEKPGFESEDKPRQGLSRGLRKGQGRGNGRGLRNRVK